MEARAGKQSSRSRAKGFSTIDLHGRGGIVPCPRICSVSSHRVSHTCDQGPADTLASCRAWARAPDAIGADGGDAQLELTSSSALELRASSYCVT